MTDEAVCSNGDQFANEAVGLNASAGAYVGGSLNFHEWANEYVFSELAAVQIRGLYDGYVFSEGYVFDFRG